MEAFTLTLVLIWIGVALVSSPFFWAKKTDKSQSPVQRRFVGLCYGFAWPIVLIGALMRRKQRQGEQLDDAELASRILGDDD